MDSKSVIRAITAAGWVEVRQVGSHKHFAKDGEPLIVTVPHPKKDIPIGTLRNIEKASKVKLR